MMKLRDFHKWFKYGFWRAFKHHDFPIEIPKTSKEKEALLKEVFESIVSARYTPSIPEAEMVINKGHGVARTVPVFCIKDYCVYYFCIKELEDILCGERTTNTFGGWTLGGNLRKYENSEIECELTDYGRYSFNPFAWIKVFGEFNSLLFSQLDKGNFSYILQFDLSNFYDSVRLDILERWMREDAKSEKGWVITLLFYLLNQWNRRNTGLHPQTVGLPQDALSDCSRILSNYYLQRYDKFAKTVCDRVGAVYFRYADDQLILLRNTNSKPNLLLLLTRNLDRYGLRVNQKKVRIWETTDFGKHRCRSIQQIFARDGDNKKTELVKKFAEEYLAIKKEELEKTWNNGLPLLNRLLWANLESLPKPLFEKTTDRLLSKKNLIKFDHRKFKRVDELNQLRRRPIDFAKHLLIIGKQTVHNAYHYEARAFATINGDARLKGCLNERLRSLEEQMKGHEIS